MNLQFKNCFATVFHLCKFIACIASKIIKKAQQTKHKKRVLFFAKTHKHSHSWESSYSFSSCFRPFIDAKQKLNHFSVGSWKTRTASEVTLCVVLVAENKGVNCWIGGIWARRQKIWITWRRGRLIALR
jgi:hypothetical protein